MKSSQPVSMLRLPRLSLVVNCIKVGGLAALAPNLVTEVSQSSVER